MVDAAERAVPAAPLPADVEGATPATATPPSGGPLRGAAMAAGSAGLLLAMLTDALSVAGRHFGFTVLGAIEIFEACIVIAATAAITIATLDAGHARVRILLERIGAGAAHGLERLSNALAALIFLALAAGSIWLASDLWGGHEMTEVLGLPLRWFRAVWVVGALTCAAIFAMRVGRGRV